MFVLRHKMLSALAFLIDRLTWVSVIGILAIHLFSTWLLMRHFEPESKIAEFDVFWWYYVVTATTIGYGDYTPVTLPGRLVGLVIMIIGIALLGGIIGKIASIAIANSEKRRKGMATLTIADHTVVIGRDSSRTMDLLRNMLAGGHKNVVLVSDHAEKPLNGSLAGFVSGTIDNVEVQERACLKEASVVIIIADDDLSALGKAVAVSAATTEKTRLVVFFQDKTNAQRFGSQTPSRVRCVTSVDMAVLVQEAEDPGAADFVNRLLDNSISENFGRWKLPARARPRKYHELVSSLVQQRVTVLGVYNNAEQVSLCPDPNMEVGPGDCIAVASSHSKNLDSVVW
jgi:voltage-gated potassium channel